MDNPIFIAALCGIVIAVVGLGILYDRAHRRRHRPGICRECNENPVGPGENQCFDCWAGR